MKILRKIAKSISVALLIFGAASALTGCVATSMPTKETFLLEAAPVALLNKSAGNRILAIRKLQIAAPYEGRSLVYRTGESAYVRDPYAEFLDWPADEIIVSARKQLRNSGVFSAVVEPGSALPPNTLLEISVNQLYGDLRQKEQPRAILSMRFVFLTLSDGKEKTILFQKEYTRQLPMKESSAPALIEAWNQALSQILAEAASDFASTRSLVGFYP